MEYRGLAAQQSRHPEHRRGRERRVRVADNHVEEEGEDVGPVGGVRDRLDVGGMDRE